MLEQWVDIDQGQDVALEETTMFTRRGPDSQGFDSSGFSGELSKCVAFFWLPF